MRIRNVAVGGLLTVLSGSVLFAQQAAPAQTRQPQPSPGQVLPNQSNEGQTNPTSGQDPLRQTNPAQAGQGQTNPSRGNQANSSNTQSGGHAYQHSSNDTLAACLAIDNQEGIQLAQFAKDKAKDQSVKEFAAMLVEEHQSCLDAIHESSPNTSQLSSLKGDSLQNKNDSDGSKPRTSNQSSANSQSISQASSANGSSVDIIQLQRELAVQCIIDSKEKLGREKKSDFDKCFVGMQLAKHAAMQTKLTVFQKHATGELKNVIADGLERTRKHMKVAEKLMESLADGDSDPSSKKSE